MYPERTSEQQEIVVQRIVEFYRKQVGPQNQYSAHILVRTGPKLHFLQPTNVDLTRIEGVSAHHTTVFKGVLHITQFALRVLRNIVAYPANKANSGLSVT